MRCRRDRAPAHRAHREHNYSDSCRGTAQEAFSETIPAEAAHRPAEFRGDRNVERLLRTFVADNEKALEDAGINVGEFTTHIFRRTAATLIEAVAGITLESRLLGHSNEQITRASYVVTAELVDPVTAQIMDEALEGLL